MLSNVVGDPAEEWANSGDVRMLLQKVLDRPFDVVLGVANTLPFGGLFDRHIVQLETLASDLAKHFDATHSNSSYAMHVWLFHLLGSRHALRSPTADARATFTRSLGMMCQRHATDYREKLARLVKDVSRVTSKGGAALVDAELAYIAHISSRATLLIEVKV